MQKGAKQIAMRNGWGDHVGSKVRGFDRFDRCVFDEVLRVLSLFASRFEFSRYKPPGRKHLQNPRTG